MRKTLKIVALVALSGALAACSMPVMKEYTGPTLPMDQTALIESGPYTYIEAVDGLAVSGLRVSVLPGEHTVSMRPSEQDQPLNEYLFYSRVNGSARFATQAGHRYLVYVDFTPASGPADEQKGSGFTWTGRILDKSTGAKIAHTDPLPLEAEPRAFPTGVPASGNMMHQ